MQLQSFICSFYRTIDPRIIDDTGFFAYKVLQVAVSMVNKNRHQVLLCYHLTI